MAACFNVSQSNRRTSQRRSNGDLSAFRRQQIPVVDGGVQEPGMVWIEFDLPPEPADGVIHRPRDSGIGKLPQIAQELGASDDASGTI